MATKHTHAKKTALLRLPPAAAAGFLAGSAALFAAAPAVAEESTLVAPEGVTGASAGELTTEVPEAFSNAPISPLVDRPALQRHENNAGPFRLGGYFWTDVGTMDRTFSEQPQEDLGANFMHGRMVLAATAQQNFGDFFGRARVEFLGLVNEMSKGQYEPHTLDAYAMFGNKVFDIQVGRFLPWEIYHRGQGIELYTPEEAGAGGAPALYWLDYGRKHFNEAGQAAVHFYPFDWLGFEVSGVYGQENSQNYYGVRPALALRFGGFQALAGYESLSQQPQREREKVEMTPQGWATRVQYDFDFLTLGVNYAQGETEKTRIEGDIDSEATFETWTAGGFADVRFLRDHSLGGGFHHTDMTNEQGENNLHDQSFVYYQYRLPFLDGVTVKAVYGFARGDIEDVDTKTFAKNDMQSFRIRLAYELK